MCLVMKRFILFLTCLLCGVFLYSQTIYSGEYWFDRDYSQKVSFSFSANGLEGNVDASALSTGFHTLNVHFRHSGVWSSPFSRSFFKVNTNLYGNDYSDLSYKCWFDEDYSSLQSGNVENGLILLPTQSIAPGFHTLYVVMEKAGLESYLSSYSFYKLNPNIDGEDFNGVTYKCWFDEDYSSLQSGNVENGLILLPTEGLERGFHTLYVVMEKNGMESLLLSRAFFKVENNVAGSQYSFSYWFDNDDAHKRTGQLQNGLIMLDTDTLSVGEHYVNIQVNSVTPTLLYRTLFYKAPPTFVVSSLTDTLQGYVEGLGEFDSLSVVQISAVANACYEFVGWNDGVTENPRSFTLTKDTIFTALFEALNFDTVLSATICEGQTYAENGFNVSEAGVYTQNLQTENGCDSIVTLNLNVNPVYNTDLFASICEGEVYNENGFNVSEAGVYSRTLQAVNGCDSVVNLTLSVNPIFNTNLSAFICEGETYSENGFNVSEAGTYTQSLQSVLGCDSVVTLTLNVNPVYNTPITATICEGSVYNENGFNVSEAGTYTQSLQSVNGCDSIVTLTLNVNPVFNTSLTATICEGSAYTENGFNVSEAGVYTLNLQTENGCDSIVILNLNVNPVYNTDLFASICEGEVYNENGFNVNEAGVYSRTLQAVNGCDSVVNLTLSVNPIFNTNLSATICEGSVYTENGFNVSEAGVYTQTLQTVNGCDSIVTLTLNVNPIFNTELSATICEGQVYTENGFNISEAGVYTQTLQTINGCDSIVTLTLNILPSYNTNLTATICQGSELNISGFNVSEAGVYTQSYTAVNGCDSIVTLTVTALPVYNTNLTLTICEGTSMNFCGFNVTEGGVYTQTFTAVNGCDSIVTLTVTELPIIHTDLTLSICEGTTLNFSGFNVSEAGTYTQTHTAANGCDSIVTLVVTTYPSFDTTITATINAGEMYSEFGFNESEAGTYVQNLQTEFGCDSTITLVLSVNSSLLDIEQTEITFFPNPTDSKITFSQAIEKVEVIDLTGKVIFTFTNAKTINLESLPSGAYYLRLTNNDKAIMQKVIKQ
ncbi:MAG: T9SS type A sorting domain-containing protein [Bacteroidales bacterium]|nr:T9SS type A sorting domain-containing protein [Bacteroidales bacterium]